MNKLPPLALIIMGIALLLVIFQFQILWKRTSCKQTFKRFSITIIIIAFLLNFAWEMLQMPLYEGMKFNLQSPVFCGLASIMDVLMVLLLFYFFALIYRKLFWFQKNTTERIATLVLVSGIGAVLLESLNISFGSWNYSRLMPIIPVVKVGLTPVLQFMILPILTYYLSFYFLQFVFRSIKNKSMP